MLKLYASLALFGLARAATELRQLEGSPFCDVEIETHCNVTMGCAWNDNACSIDPFNCDLTSEFYCDNPDNHCVWVDGSCLYNDVVGEMEVSNTVVDGELLISGISASSISFLEREALEQLLRSTFGGNELLLTLSSSECGLAPLCGSEGEMLPLPTGYQNELNVSPSMSMPCCAKKDTVPESDCQRKPDPGESTCRSQGLLTPYCDPTNPAAKCDQLVEEEAMLNLRVATVTPGKSDCCLTCTCFGDPHCIGFFGEHDTWNICDARSTISCNYLQSKCSTLDDPAMNKCVWNSNPSHNVMRDGSRCTPNPASPAAWMDMYSADDFSIKLHAGERGSLQAANVTLSTGAWFYLHAVDCFERPETPWQSSPGAIVPSSWQHVSTTLDEAWVIGDDITGIEARLRCVRNEANGVYGGLRINVEQVVEPNPNYGTERTNLSGVCHVGAIADKTGHTWTTDTILATPGKCVNLREDVEIARVVCDNPSLHRDTVTTCAKEFCQEFSFPNFPSVASCESEILADWPTGFCTAHEHDPDLRSQCISDIAEYSWEHVVSAYRLKDELEQENCVDSLDDLPSDLDECTPGLRLQYKAEGGDWVTFRGIPTSKTICRSGIVINATSTELFTRPVRLTQCSLPGRCVTGNHCTPQPGFQGNFKFERLNGEIFEVTAPPTGAPSGSPTGSPTGAPSTSPSLYPTKSPLPSGSTHWPSSAPTQWPTREPTQWPTRAPTQWPTRSPTQWPTNEPTQWPTRSPSRNPTSVPSASPTLYPTYSPTASPTNSPTTSPTLSPSLSPTVSPSGSPTTSPTSAPTLSPTYSPAAAFVETLAPTAAPTPWPERRLSSVDATFKQIAMKRTLEEETAQVKASFTVVFQDNDIATLFLEAFNTFPSVIIENLGFELNTTWVGEEHPGVNIAKYQAGFSPSAGTLRFMDEFIAGIHDDPVVAEGICAAIAHVMNLSCGTSVSVLLVYSDPEDGNITLLLEINALNPLQLLESLRTQESLRKIQTELKKSDDPVLSSLTLTAAGRAIQPSDEATGDENGDGNGGIPIAGVVGAVLGAGCIIAGVLVFQRRRQNLQDDQVFEQELGVPGELELPAPAIEAGGI